MPHCVAVGCNFQSKGNKNSDISLHCFPNEKERRAEWERACGRTQLPKYPRLCSRHFSPDDFESFCRRRLLKELTGASGHKRRLKPDAMPTIFPHKAPKRLRQASEKRSEKRQRQATPDAPVPDCERPGGPAGECEPADTEEPDDPPGHVDRPPVSVQSSSTATDAATQTHVGTSDAAVQWPRDVHYPIAMDHIYAGKRLEEQPKHLDRGKLPRSFRVPLCTAFLLTQSSVINLFAWLYCLICILIYCVTQHSNLY